MRSGSVIRKSQARLQSLDNGFVCVPDETAEFVGALGLPDVTPVRIIPARKLAEEPVILSREPVRRLPALTTGPEPEASGSRARRPRDWGRSRRRDMRSRDGCPGPWAVVTRSARCAAASCLAIMEQQSHQVLSADHSRRRQHPVPGTLQHLQRSVRRARGCPTRYREVCGVERLGTQYQAVHTQRQMLRRRRRTRNIFAEAAKRWRVDNGSAVDGRSPAVPACRLDGRPLRHDQGFPSNPRRG